MLLINLTLQKGLDTRYYIDNKNSEYK